MIALGIDPGLTGAWAILGLNSPVVGDLPTKLDPQNRKLIDGPALLAELRPWLPDDQEIVATIEHVWAMPKQGVVSAFRFGDTFGTLRTIADLLGYEAFLVKPTFWKREFGLIGTEKDEARVRAIEEWPSMAEALKRKKDCDRADALWVAKYGSVHGREHLAQSRPV